MKLWVPAGGKTLRCTAHPQVPPWRQGKDRRCPECPPPGTPDVAAAVVVVDASSEQPVPAPKGCRTLEQREARLTLLADHAAVQCGAILKDGKKATDGKKSRISQSTAMKWLAEAIKAEKAAAELGAPRERMHRTKRLEGLARDILAGRKRRDRGGSN